MGIQMDNADREMVVKVLAETKKGISHVRGEYEVRDGAVGGEVIVSFSSDGVLDPNMRRGVFAVAEAELRAAGFEVQVAASTLFASGIKWLRVSRPDIKAQAEAAAEAAQVEAFCRLGERMVEAGAKPGWEDRQDAIHDIITEALQVFITEAEGRGYDLAPDVLRLAAKAWDARS